MVKNQPLNRQRVGRFQVTLWRNTKIVAANDEHFRPEREIKTVRACVQHSKYSHATNTWVRQQVWCGAEELRDLANALDTFAEEP